MSHPTRTPEVSLAVVSVYYSTHGTDQSEGKPVVFPKGVRIDIPWEPEPARRTSGHSDERESVRDSRQVVTLLVGSQIVEI